MPKVNSFAVTAYKDITLGVWPDGCTRYIDCNFSFVKNENVALTVGGDKCGTYQAGDVFEVGATPEGVTAVLTAKIKTKKGFLWISPASLATLKDSCNACCTE